MEIGIRELCPWDPAGNIGILGRRSWEPTEINDRLSMTKALRKPRSGDLFEEISAPVNRSRYALCAMYPENSCD